MTSHYLNQWCLLTCIYASFSLRWLMPCGCWWPDDTRSGVISIPGSDLIHSKHLILSTRRVNILMPQSHPTTGPVRFLSPVRFLARKAEWSVCRNFTSVLFPWSHQATGPARLDTAYLWLGLIIRRNPRVPKYNARTGIARPPPTGIFNVFQILRGPCVTRKGAVRRRYWHVSELTQP